MAAARFPFMFGLLLWLSTGFAATSDLPTFPWMVTKYGPSVVNISTTQLLNQSTIPDGFDNESYPNQVPLDDLYQRYFDDDDSGFPDDKSLGSGFIISGDGFILTCAHVVKYAREIRVKLADRREYTAKLIGADRRSDVALLKINASNLPAVVIGDPGTVKVGDWVLAIGAPFGFENSATSGIVSAKGRSLQDENYVPFIQTDVAINPGNSGGPLFNLNGEVIGINSQIYSRTGGFMGLSFAVPIDIAMRIGEQLKELGHVRRGWIGVAIQDVTRDLALSFGLGSPKGALISDIMPDSPAAKSDLKVGDIVLEYGGKLIDLSSDLPPLVGQTQPGNRVPVSVFRKGKRLSVVLTIGELEERGIKVPVSRAPEGGSPSIIGLTLEKLTMDQRDTMGITHGIFVKSVVEGPAWRAGVRPGDVIVQVNGKPVDDVDDFNRLIVHSSRKRPLALRIRRGAAAIFVALRLSG